jgi:hypothetical protein
MILWLKNLWRWLAAVLRWVRRSWLVLVAPVSVAVVFMIVYALPLTVEPRVRIIGLLLQLLGLTTVAYGLRETRKLFNRPTLVAERLRQFPPFTPKTYVLSAEPGTYHITGHAAEAQLQALSIEQRVEMLEGRLAEQDRLMHKTWTNIRDTLESERRSRESADSTLQRQLEEFAAGGLHLETIGLFWILVGVILATASVEIAKLFCS